MCIICWHTFNEHVNKDKVSVLNKISLNCMKKAVNMYKVAVISVYLCKLKMTFLSVLKYLNCQLKIKKYK